MNLGFKLQQLLISQKETQPAIRCFLMREHNTTCSCSKGIKHKSDPVPGSNCQFVANSRTAKHLN